MSTERDPHSAAPQPTRRSRQVSFSAAPWLDRALTAEAEQLGMSVGALVRSIVTQEMRRRGYAPKPMQEER